MNAHHPLTKTWEAAIGRRHLYTNILAPIDLSKGATVNLDSALGLAEHYNANLWLLGFSSEPAIGTDTRGLCRYVWDSWDRRAQIRLWDWALKARERHYQTFPLLVGGQYDAGEIIRTAERLLADLIVVPVQEAGPRSSGFANAQIDELLRKSATPVFVAIPSGAPEKAIQKIAIFK